MADMKAQELEVEVRKKLRIDRTTAWRGLTSPPASESSGWS
jgi:hypothetical protein